jgi:hypothetical protein
MRHPASRVRGAIAIGVGALLVLGAAGGTLAARAEVFTIVIDFDPGGGETFASSHPLLCPTGEAITDFERGAGNFNAAGSFHLTKEIVCDDGSGTFVIRVDAGTNFVTGGGTTGGWSVVPGSGTGDYAGLKGGGAVVGINGDGAPIDLVDHYTGWLRS